MSARTPYTDGMTTETIEQGYYLLQQDSPAPRSIAQIVYNEGNRYPGLVEANPEVWMKGDRLLIPGRPGIATVVEKGERAMDVIRRVLPSQRPHIYIERFFDWNGGPNYVLEAEEVVFIPDR